MIQRSNDIEKIKCNIIHDLHDVLTFDILHLYINVASFVFICDIILASISCTSAAPFTQTKKRVPRCGKMPRPMTVDPKASGVKLLNFPMDEWMNVHGDRNVQNNPEYSLYSLQDVVVWNQNTFSERHRCAFYLAICQLEIVSPLPSPSGVFCGCL